MVLVTGTTLPERVLTGLHSAFELARGDGLDETKSGSRLVAGSAFRLPALVAHATTVKRPC